MGNWGFESRRDAERAAEATRRSERADRGGAPGRGRWPVISAAGLVLVHVPAGGISPFGTATVTFYEPADPPTDPPILGTRTETIVDPIGVAWDGNRKLWATYWGGALRPVVQVCE